MSNQGDRFSSGFLAGTIFGGIIGGFVGTWLATKLNEQETEELAGLEGRPASVAKEQLKRIRQRVFNVSDDVTIEEARVGLDDKIAQLNDAIDQARQQLSKVNGAGTHQDL
jgi:citrate lyase gamma subunit